MGQLLGLTQWFVSASYQKDIQPIRLEELLGWTTAWKRTCYICLVLTNCHKKWFRKCRTIRHEAGLQRPVPSWNPVRIDWTVNGSAFDKTVVCEHGKNVSALVKWGMHVWSGKKQFNSSGQGWWVSHSKVRLYVLSPDVARSVLRARLVQLGKPPKDSSTYLVWHWGSICKLSLDFNPFDWYEPWFKV